MPQPSIRMIDKLMSYFGEFEYGVLVEEEDKTYLKAVSGDKKGFIFARLSNSEGRNIFIRPARNERFLFLDDIKDLVPHNERPGRLIVETSQGNYQIWIKCDRAMQPDEKRHWQKHFLTDKGSNACSHWGRAPGTYNLKPNRKDERGFYPMTRIVSFSEGEESFPEYVPPVEIRTRPLESTSCEGKKRNGSKSWNDFACEDKSSADFRYALHMLGAGVDPDEAKDRIRAESPEIVKRKKGRVESYLTRTVEKAMCLVSE